jgi:hypothetical protein
LIETSLEFRESPPATALVVRTLPVAAAYVIAVVIATIALAFASMVIHPVVFVMVTVADVPPVAAASLHAPIVTVGLFYPTSSVQLASRLATWLNTATCWPPPFALNGT